MTNTPVADLVAVSECIEMVDELYDSVLARKARQELASLTPTSAEPVVHLGYLRVMDVFDKNETAGSFLREDGEGGFASGVQRMADEITRLTVERDDWAYKYNESCNTYSAMHVALEKAEEERDQALKVSEHRQRNSAETWEAMQTMRNAINEHVPMPSMESDLLQGPENSVFCAAVAEAVITGIQARAAAAAMDMRERAASLTERYMIDAGVGSSSYIEICREVAGAIRNLPIDPDAQKALDQMLTEAEQSGYANAMEAERKDSDQRISKAREDAIREAEELVEDHFPGTVYASSRTKCLRAILALLNDGDQP